MTNQGFCFHIGLPRHVAQRMLSVALQEMRDTSRMEEALLRGSLDASYRNVSLTMFVPKPFHSGPPPTDIWVNAALLNQGVQGVLGRRVRGVPRADVEPHSRRHRSDPSVSFFLRKNAGHGYDRVVLIGFMFRNHARIGVWPALEPSSNALCESVGVHITSISDDAKLAIKGDCLQRLLETLNFEPIQALILQGSVNSFRLNDDGCPKPPLLVALF